MRNVSDCCSEACYHPETVVPGVEVRECARCGTERVVYMRPNTGNHPDHPPVPGGYRGGDYAPSGQQVINPGLATEAVIGVTSELEGDE